MHSVAAGVAILYIMGVAIIVSCEKTAQFEEDDGDEADACACLIRSNVLRRLSAAGLGHIFMLFRSSRSAFSKSRACRAAVANSTQRSDSSRFGLPSIVDR